MQQKNDRRPSPRDFLKLVKIRLSIAIAFSAVTGYLVYNSNPDFDFLLLVAGILFLTCGSSALNQYTERHQDALMKRTMNRPVASDKISGSSALIVSVFLIIAGFLLLLKTGIMPFILGCSGVILYNLLYTYLKRITPLALLPGSLVGSVPPLIGYTSAGGTAVNDKILLFAVFMFLWQIPHFWLLLLRYGKEYQAAGFKTAYDHLSLNQIKLATALWIIMSCSLVVSFGYCKEVFNPIVSGAILILTVGFLIMFLVYMAFRKDDSGLKYSFAILNLYSFLIMLFLIADSFVS